EVFLINLPVTASLNQLVRLAHQRWAIEQQYQELKTELGLDHFEARTFPGWHHHVGLTAITYKLPAGRTTTRRRRPDISGDSGHRPRDFHRVLICSTSTVLTRIEALRSFQLRI